jgi:membrane-associated phospholipid phosphatase
MPLLALVLAALIAGGAVARLSLVVSRRQPGRAAMREIAAEVAARPDMRRASRRVDPASATSLALALALAIAIGGGLVLAVLAYLVRSDNRLVRLDRSVADWGQRHASGFTDNVLSAISNAGQPASIGALAAVFALAVTIRTRNRWVVPFVLVVVAGNGFLTTTVKGLADRARPAFDPIAETLGPSFPSGHSSWSAAFLAAAALVLSRGRGPQARAALAGAAAALAVAVAATRVLLGVHWLSDVVAGLALGWAWFAACSIAFGGRVLRFGASAEEVAREGAMPRRSADEHLAAAVGHDDEQAPPSALGLGMDGADRELGGDPKHLA